MKKILLVFDTDPPTWNGIVRVVLEIKKKLEFSFNYDVKFIHSNYGNPKVREIHDNAFIKPLLVINDFPVICTGFFRLRKHINWADYIFVNETASLSLYALFWSKIFRKKIYLLKHVREVELTNSSIQNILLKKVSGVFVKYECRLFIKYATKSLYLGNHDLVGNNPRTMFMGLDYSRFNIIEKYSTNNHNNKDGLTIGSVSRLSLDKNIKLVYKIFSKLLLINNNIKLMCIGDGSVIPPQNLQGNQNFKWIRNTETIEEYYRSMDILLLVSNTETGPLVILEAMACGVIPIAKDVGLCSSLIKDNYNGFIIKNHTSDVFKQIENILEELIRNPNKMTILSSNARASIMKNIPDWKIVTEKIIESTINR